MDKVRVFAVCASLSLAPLSHATVSSTKAVGPASLPCHMVDNLCYLTGSYNNLSNLALILDTGSTLSVLDSSRAAALGVPPTTCFSVQGPGGSSQQFCQYNGITISAGSSSLQNQEIISGSFSYVGEQDGAPTDGTLGANIFLNYVVDLDYSSAQATLSNPSTWDPSGHGQALPFTMSQNVPVVQASITLPDGKQLQGQFLVDTGQAGSGVLISADFQKAHPELLQELNASGTVLHPPNVSAVGGGVDLLLSRIPTLQIGSFSLSQPITSLLINESQIYAGFAGAIGVDILSRFDVAFDYSRQQIYLKPNASYDNPFDFDRSGMMLKVAPPDFHHFVVAGVLDSSPASDAGIQSGDVILSVNGVDASDLTLSDVQKILKSPFDICVLIIERAGSTFPIIMILRTML